MGGAASPTTWILGLVARLREPRAPVPPAVAESASWVARLDALAEDERRLSPPHRRPPDGGMPTDDAAASVGYRAVIDGYRLLLRDSAARLEALKRLLFLWWITTVEPRCNTGVPDPTSEMIALIAAELRTVMHERAGDAELDAMLQWYWTIYGDPLREAGLELPDQRSASATSLAAMLERGMATSGFRHRGLLDDYWRELTAAARAGHSEQKRNGT